VGRHLLAVMPSASNAAVTDAVDNPAAVKTM
jgi:hypothetical protein